MFTSVSIPCYDFTLEDGDAKRVSVIVAPIKLVEFEDGSLGVSFACSRGAFCHDPHYIPLCQTILNTIDYKTLSNGSLSVDIIITLRKVRFRASIMRDLLTYRMLA